MPTRCDHCGDESTLDDAFYRSGSRWTPGLCPVCRERQCTKRYAIGLAIYFAVAIGFGGFATTRGDDSDRNVALALSLFLPCLIVSTLLHEIGHAFGALLAGLRLFTVCLGTIGPTALCVQVFGYDIAMRAIPLGGHALVSIKTFHFVRLRYFAMLVGGPMTNVACVVGALVATNTWPTNELLTTAMFTWVAANGLLLLTTLWPENHWINQSWVPSDGLQLMRLRRQSPQDFEAMHAVWFYLEGLESRERGRFEESLAWFQQGLASYPTNIGIRIGLGIALRDLGRFTEARQCFLDLSNDESVSFETKVICRNDLAWTNLLLGDAELRPEAEQLSKQAFAMFPWITEVRGTRGSVLVESGEFDAGIKLLERALVDQRDGETKAFTAAYIARALARKGRPKEAELRLQQARTLDPKCPLLGRVEIEIAALRSSAAT